MRVARLRCTKHGRTLCTARDRPVPTFLGTFYSLSFASFMFSRDNKEIPGVFQGILCENIFSGF